MAIQTKRHTKLLRLIVLGDGQRGVEDSRATFITYHSANSTEPVTYDIHPYALAVHRGNL